MAQQTTVRLVDDLTGDEAHETVEFGLDGKHFVIDLSNVNAARLREVVAPFMSSARKVGGRLARATGAKMTVTSNRGPAKADAEQNRAIRVWARENGWPELADRGRIPEEITTAYMAKAGRPSVTAEPPPTVGEGNESNGAVLAPEFTAAATAATAEPKGKATGGKAVSGTDSDTLKTGGSSTPDKDAMIAFRQSRGLPLTAKGNLTAPMQKQTIKLMREAGLISA